MVESYRMKICLAGEEAVGKTSLIRRFVHSEFDDSYKSTLGANVTKHVCQLDGQGDADSAEVVMLIWDIMGQQPFLQLMKEAYFDGADAILGVCDLTRRETLQELESWIREVQDVCGRVPVLCAGNKADLTEEREIRAADFDSVGRLPYLMMSAKTGEGVEEAFRRVAANHVLSVKRERTLETASDQMPVTGDH